MDSVQFANLWTKKAWWKQNSFVLLSNFIQYFGSCWVTSLKTSVFLERYLIFKRWMTRQSNKMMCYNLRTRIFKDCKEKSRKACLSVFFINRRSRRRRRRMRIHRPRNVLHYWNEKVFWKDYAKHIVDEYTTRIAIMLNSNEMWNSIIQYEHHHWKITIFYEC